MHQQLKMLLPKSPVSAYMLFCKAKRHKVQKHHPELNTKEITLKLSKKWKEMKSQQVCVHVLAIQQLTDKPGSRYDDSPSFRMVS